MRLFHADAKSSKPLMDDPVTKMLASTAFSSVSQKSEISVALKGGLTLRRISAASQRSFHEQRALRWDILQLERISCERRPR